MQNQLLIFDFYSILKFLLNKIKNDEKFFNAFINFLEKNEDRHELIVRIVREKLIESCMKSFSKK